MAITTDTTEIEAESLPDYEDDMKFICEIEYETAEERDAVAAEMFRLQAEADAQLAAVSAEIEADIKSQKDAFEARLAAQREVFAAEREAVAAEIAAETAAALNAIMAQQFAAATRARNEARTEEIGRLVHRGCYVGFDGDEGVRWNRAWSAEITDEELDHMRLVARVADGIREARDDIRPGFPWGWMSYIRPLMEDGRLVDVEIAVVEAGVWLGDSEELVVEEPTAPEGYVANPRAHWFMMGSPEDEAMMLTATLVGWPKRPGAPTVQADDNIYLSRIPF